MKSSLVATRIRALWMSCLFLALCSCGGHVGRVLESSNLRLSLRFAQSATAGATIAAGAPSGLDVLSVQVLAVGFGREEVPLLREELPLLPGQTSFQLQFRVPRADRYHIRIDALGQRQRAARIDSTSRGLQFFGEAVVERAMLGASSIVVSMKDVVPRAVLRSAGTSGLRPSLRSPQGGFEIFQLTWPKIEHAIGYRVVTINPPDTMTSDVPGESFPVDPSISPPSTATFGVMALLADGRTSAESERIQCNESPPQIDRLFPSVLYDGGIPAHVQLTGAGLLEKDVVFWNGEVLESTWVQDTLEVDVPGELLSMPHDVAVWIENGEGLATDAVNVTIARRASKPSPPALQRIEPDSVYAAYYSEGTSGNETIALYGAGFLPGATVLIRDEVRAASWESDSVLRVPLPFGLAIQPEGHVVQVLNPDAQRSGVSTLTVLRNPWRSLTWLLGSGRAGMAAASAGGDLYAIGGGRGARSDRFVAGFDPASRVWFEVDSLITGRSFGAAVTLGDSIHLVGGVRDSLSALRSGPVETLPVNAVWTTGTNMPTPRASLALGALRGRLYAAGGDLIGNRGISTGISNAFEVYNPVNKTWAAAPLMPTSRSAAGAAVVGDRFYVLGGREQVAPGGAMGGAPGLASDRVEVYDVATARWVTPSPTRLPRARCGCGATTLGGRIYLIGGFGASSPLLFPVDWVDAYDPATNTWSPCAPMPAQLVDPVVTVLGGEVVVIGGAGYGFQNSVVYAYRPELDVLAPGALTSSAARSKSAGPARRVRAAPR